MDALVCTLPANVLMISGYWPVVGSAAAIATADGRVAIVAPEDERSLAERGWATEVRPYTPGSLQRLTGPAEAIRQPLAAVLATLGVRGGRIGIEDGATYEPSSYAAMYVYGVALGQVVRASAADARFVSAGPALEQLRAKLTVDEVGQVRLACDIAGAAFGSAARELRPGVREPAAAAGFSAGLSELGLAREGVGRAGGFAFCMSGPNAALAGAAYARTRDRELAAGDVVLVHCNSYVDGYWTDITRTFCLGEPDSRKRDWYDAVFAARSAALQTIRPGVRAADVDRAARDVLAARGFGKEFTHGLGHNVGFSAISAEFPPRLHPASDDRLDVGMTFNVEPAIYAQGYGGIRHCDVVTLGPEGPEVLTPFQAKMDDLVIR